MKSNHLENGLSDYFVSLIRLSLADTPLVALSACDNVGFMFSVELPWKVRCSFRIMDNTDIQGRLLETVNRIRVFILEDYLESNLMTVESSTRFLNLPGNVEFLDEEEKYSLMFRLAIISAQERFGSKNIFSAEFISDKTLVFHTREGQFSVRIDDFKYNLKDTLENMSHYMRKPIRKRYDKECNEKKLNQE